MTLVKLSSNLTTKAINETEPKVKIVVLGEIEAARVPPNDKLCSKCNRINPLFLRPKEIRNKMVIAKEAQTLSIIYSVREIHLSSEQKTLKNY